MTNYQSNLLKKYERAFELLKEMHYYFNDENCIEELFGEKCSTQDWHCPTCRVYMNREEIRELIDEITSIRKYDSEFKSVSNTHPFVKSFEFLQDEPDLYEDLNNDT